MRTIRVLLIVIVGSLGDWAVKGDNDDLFSSIAEVERLYQIEVGFSRDILSFTELLERSAQAFRKYVDLTYPEGPMSGDIDIESYVGNPLNAFGMVGRLGTNFQDLNLKSLLTDSSLPDLQRKLANDSLLFPTLSNFEEVVSSIGLLQEAYALNCSDLANGIIQVRGKSFQSDHILDARELVEIGIGACNQGWWDNGLSWLKIAQKRDKGQDPAFTEALKRKIKSGEIYHDKLLDQRGQFGKDHRCFSKPFDPKLRKKKKFKKISANPFQAELLKHTLFDLSVSQTTRVALSHEMCRNGVRPWRSPEMDTQLRCRWLHHSNPFLRLAPFKMELVNEQPFVCQFHDFMHNNEMEHFQAYAKPNLFRSVTGHEDQKRTNKIRTSKQAWLRESWFTFNVSQTAESVKDMEIPPIPFNPMKYVQVVDRHGFNTAKRIKMATGLETQKPFSAEAFQVANYGLGGHYQLHIDSQGYFDGEIGRVTSPEQFRHNTVVGDRLATFMAYLSDVQAGGHTVFPLLGISAQPTKGSAIFWINLQSTGKRDSLTTHGGCPVLLGSKWITNKWISSNDQFQTLPCPLSPSQGNYPVFQRWTPRAAQHTMKMDQRTTYLLVVYTGMCLASAFAGDEGHENNEIAQHTLKEALEAKMASHASAVRRQIKVLDNFLNTYYSDYNYTKEDAHEYVSNPINTYMLIKRTSLEWPQIKKVLFNDTLDRDYEEIVALSESINASNDP
eukprot:maker-scaffold487_size158652-snap-gene-0.42 protein:Tk00177 transcript:maker-scaffold487_size158652-snap-gene-0.42-mRNA-1 annotation:"af495541_1prolyl 4-hydroxylase alpha-related protein ph4"